MCDNGDGTFMMFMFLFTGADLLWIETPIPNLKKIASLVAAIRAQVRDFDNLKKHISQCASKRFRELRKVCSQHCRLPMQSCATTTAPRSTGPWASGRRCSFHICLKIVYNLVTCAKIIYNCRFSRCTRSSQPAGTCLSTTRCFSKLYSWVFSEIIFHLLRQWVIFLGLGKIFKN